LKPVPVRPHLELKHPPCRGLKRLRTLPIVANSREKFPPIDQLNQPIGQTNRHLEPQLLPSRDLKHLLIDRPNQPRGRTNQHLEPQLPPSRGPKRL
jgi:hypothetical protein